MRKVVFAVLVGLLSASVVFGVGSKEEAAGASGGMTKIVVTVPHPSALNWIEVHVAKGEGFFAQEGLDVSVEAVDGSAQVLQAMSAGHSQIGIPGPGPVLAARSRGVKVKHIYNLYAQASFAFVVRAGASYKSPIDLKGKVIGIGTADGGEVSFVKPILADAGMVEGRDYTFLVVGDGGTAAVAFERKEIEAYSAGVPDMAIMNAKGLLLKEITPVKNLGYFGNGFAAMESFMDSNPKAIEGFGRAIVRASVFMRDPANRLKVLKHAAAGNPQEAEDSKLSQALLDIVTTRHTPLDKSTGWGYFPPESWKMWQRELVASGALKAPLDDLEAAYTNKYVPIWNQK